MNARATEYIKVHQSSLPTTKAQFIFCVFVMLEKENSWTLIRGDDLIYIGEKHNTITWVYLYRYLGRQAAVSRKVQWLFGMISCLTVAMPDCSGSGCSKQALKKGSSSEKTISYTLLTATISRFTLFWSKAVRLQYPGECRFWSMT